MYIRTLMQSIKKIQLIVQQSSVLHSVCELAVNPAFAQAAKTVNSRFQKREGTGASFLYWLDWKSKH